jgi:hypothetical protein
MIWHMVVMVKNGVVKSEKFVTTDLGELHWLLGMEVKRDRSN